MGREDGFWRPIHAEPAHQRASKEAHARNRTATSGPCVRINGLRGGGPRASRMLLRGIPPVRHAGISPDMHRAYVRQVPREPAGIVPMKRHAHGHGTAHSRMPQRFACPDSAPSAAHKAKPTAYDPRAGHDKCPDVELMQLWAVPQPQRVDMPDSSTPCARGVTQRDAKAASPRVVSRFKRFHTSFDTTPCTQRPSRPQSPALWPTPRSQRSHDGRIAPAVAACPYTGQQETPCQPCPETYINYPPSLDRLCDGTRNLQPPRGEASLCVIMRRTGLYLHYRGRFAGSAMRHPH